MGPSRLDALVREQESVRELSRETIEALQLEKLNALLPKLKQRGGFYAALPSHLSSLRDLSSLPFTTEEDLARSVSGMLLTSQSRVDRVLSDATSGTTGLPKRVFYSARDLENTVRLYMAGLGELIGPGDVTLICFPFSGPNGLGELIAEAIRRLGAEPLKAGPFLSYGEYRAVLLKNKPNTFVGTPVRLLSILRACGVNSLRRALVSADASPRSVTEACETLLGSKLFFHYGSREMGMAGAITCPAHEGMHLRENHMIAEIVDSEGRVLPRGEYGELVITTVGMEAMPLIRYRTGDYTRIFPAACPCGCELLRLDELRRGIGESSLASADELLFRQEHVVDCRLAVKNGDFDLTVLTSGSVDGARLADAVRSVFPGTGVTVRLMPVRDTDTAFYPGKRTLIHE